MIKTTPEFRINTTATADITASVTALPLGDVGFAPLAALAMMGRKNNGPGSFPSTKKSRKVRAKRKPLQQAARKANRGHK